jgi:hypothetical protein
MGRGMTNDEGEEGGGVGSLCANMGWGGAADRGSAGGKERDGANGASLPGTAANEFAAWYRKHVKTSSARGIV